MLDLVHKISFKPDVATCEHQGLLLEYSTSTIIEGLYIHIYVNTTRLISVSLHFPETKSPYVILRPSAFFIRCFIFVQFFTLFPLEDLDRFRIFWNCSP